MKTNKLIFLFSILFSMLATNASAYDFAVKNADGVMIYYDYNKDKSEVGVTHKDEDYNSYSGSVVIPKEVTYNNKTLKVAFIGGGAFYSCSSLTSVTIPNTVRSIGRSAFGGCSGLTSLDIPNSVTIIGEYVFDNCSSLTSITIPNGVTSIKNFAFWGCKSLKSVTIPNSVTSIGYCAFYSCNSLTSITIPNSVTSIGDKAFQFSGLTSITIPNSVTSIGEALLSGSTALTSIVVEKNNPIYDSRNNCNAIIETKSNKLISGCKNTVIPNDVTSIGDDAFGFCSSLTSITIPNSVKSIGVSAFFNCTKLTSVTIPNSVTSIGDKAFQCTSGGLTSVTIGNSVTSIGYRTFNCLNLKTVTSKITKPFAIKDNAFVEYSDATLYVPKGTVAKYKATDGWKNFKNIVEEGTTTGIEDVEAIDTDNKLDTSNAIYDINGKRLPATSLDELPSGLYIVNGKKVVK